MKNIETDFLLEQIKSILLNKPLPTLESYESENFAKLQEAIIYLSDCLKESNNFIKEIANGNLAAQAPSRKNFLAGSIKELHSGLKHLTWQANQVAQGDYHQHVSFLGEFSDAFNKMITQLKEREEELLAQSIALEQNNELMELIMDGMTDCIAVISLETQEILYINVAAERLLYNQTTQVCLCDTDCSFMQKCLKKNSATNQKHHTSIEHCEIKNSFFHVDNFSLYWNGILAYAVHIVDVTKEYKEKSKIEDMAYHDELTGLFNRRHCTAQIEKLLKDSTPFTFCLLDADKLKFANDTFGHNAGDEYLKTIAKEISAPFRSSDTICRLGGDEFAIILQSTNTELITRKLEEVNAKLSTLSTKFPMSLSYGAMPVNPDSCLSLKNILDEADKMMYENKRKKKASL